MALDRKKRPTTWRDAWRIIAFTALYVAIRLNLDRYLPPAVAPWVIGVVTALFIAAFVWWIVWIGRDHVRDRRAFRTLRRVHEGGRWPLGEPYDVELDAWDNGGRVWHTMRIDERAVTFRSHAPFSRPIEFVGVDIVRVHASWIEIVSLDESVRVVPRSYADRERLLWELAVRWPDAIHRGIDEIPAPPASTPAPPAAPGDVEHLDRRMTGSGLASALAGPMDRGNPAPPRKSGLGNGLFVAPPEETRDDAM
jgi:hypothetical protein